MSTPLDPIDPTVIAPGVATIPLPPTVWDDAEDGQVAVTGQGEETTRVWQRREGLWHLYPWWQGMAADELLAVCADPEEWAYDSGWPRHYLEGAHGPLTYVDLPLAGGQDDDGSEK